MNRAAVWLLVLMPMLTGCAAVAVGAIGAGALALHDRRTLPALVDDQQIEIAATRSFHQDELLGGGDTHIRVVSFNGLALLAGEVPREEQKARAEKLTSRVEGVRRVVNELAVRQPSSIGRRLKDMGITTQVKSALLGVDVEGFDFTRVKVVTVRGDVYLMGLVTPTEAQAVVDRVRYLRGVNRIVKVFEQLNA